MARPHAALGRTVGPDFGRQHYPMHTEMSSKPDIVQYRQSFGLLLRILSWIMLYVAHADHLFWEGALPRNKPRPLRLPHLQLGCSTALQQVRLNMVVSRSTFCGFLGLQQVRLNMVVS